MTITLLDTGVLIAMLDRDDRHHAQARAIFDAGKGPLIVPLVVVPEVCYLSHKYLGPNAEQAFLSSLADEELAIDWGVPADLRRAVELLRERPELGFVDTMIVSVAERLKVRRIATLDRRHFATLRPRHCTAFELVP